MANEKGPDVPNEGSFMTDLSFLEVNALNKLDDAGKRAIMLATLTSLATHFDTYDGNSWRAIIAYPKINSEVTKLLGPARDKLLDSARKGNFDAVHDEDVLATYNKAVLVIKALLAKSDLVSKGLKLLQSETDLKNLPMDLSDRAFLVAAMKERGSEYKDWLENATNDKQDIGNKFDKVEDNVRAFIKSDKGKQAIGKLRGFLDKK